MRCVTLWSTQRMDNSALRRQKLTQALVQEGLDVLGKAGVAAGAGAEARLE